MEFKKMRTERLSDKVVKEIFSMIEKGSLKPGDKLPTETVFAEKLGVSRGILREALTILQSQGYISRKPKDGTYIRELPIKNRINEPIIAVFKKASYKDLLEMRESLEQKIVELVIERATNEEIEDIEKMLKSPNKEDKGVLQDQDFHLKIAILSKNIILINFMNIYYDLIHDIAENTLKNPKRFELVTQEHISIIEAIKERDVEKAKKAILLHLNMVEKSIDSIEIQQGIKL